VKNADLAMSQVLELLLIQCLIYIDIHPTAVVDKSATIGIGTKIGAGKMPKRNHYPNVNAP
jgi:UDP-3-O-[3-hydroxymyristoyl] glucosamine N-acyltransferase